MGVSAVSAMHAEFCLGGGRGNHLHNPDLVGTKGVMVL